MKNPITTFSEISRQSSGATLFYRAFWLLAALSFTTPSSQADLDADANTLSDVWQKKYGVGAISATADADGDGFTNGQEFRFATDPTKSSSRPSMAFSVPGIGLLDASWYGEKGKSYSFQSSSDLSSWLDQTRQVGTGKTLFTSLENPGGQKLFTRVGASDIDTDGDGLSDWEELSTGYDPARVYSEGLGTVPSVNDKNRLATAMAASNVITVVAADSNITENWPDPGRFVIRRAGNPNTLTISFALSGTAANGTDYTSPGSTATIPFGKDETMVNITALVDAAEEDAETITLTLLTDSAYSLGSSSTATLNLTNSNGSAVSTKAAARFLTQSTFGPTTGELARVTSLGYSGWIDDQFLRSSNLHLPIVQTWQAELLLIPPAVPTVSSVVSTEHRMEAWWRQSMRNDIASDPLRQRTAFALSQIFVISDRMESLSSDQRGMTSYYDTLLNGAFGTYRQMLENVTRHPWMGLYLSAMKNRKANVALNRFPDENFAREVMQLFSIGLWRLNPNGTQILSAGSDLGPDGETIPAGQPIPSYGQSQISEIARIFTGMSYGTRFTSATDATEIPTTAFFQSNNVPWQPMKMFDSEHDIAAKSISLPGVATFNLPARTASGSTAGDADLTAFLNYLSNHPNVPPFISRLLIQRLVTSNPSPAYVGRVSAAFTNSSGDMKAVIRAILLDSEARDYSQLSIASHGLLREPYTRYIAMARALDAAPADASAGGRYRGFGSLESDFLQRPLSAPSVFNFYSPENRPAGPLRDAGLTSPEMQITNSVSAITGPNRHSSGLSCTSVVLNTATIPTNGGWTQINHTGQNDNATTPTNEFLWNTRINEAPWLALATTDPAALTPDAMVRKLDELLCYGNMSQPTFRAITRALNRLNDPFATGLTTIVRDERIRSRLRIAIHLTTTSADYAVLK